MPAKDWIGFSIVQSALRAIDREGAQGLTMRGLGQDLGVEAMSLYRYVSGREDLLEAVVAHLLDGLQLEIDGQLAETWQGYLQTLAHQVRRIAVEHPAAFPLIATRHPATPWLRPPLRSLELVEEFLSTLSSHGLSDHQVVAAYRAFSSFLLGHLLLEVAARGAQTSPVEVPLGRRRRSSTQPGRPGRPRRQPHHHATPGSAQRGPQCRGVRDLVGDAAGPVGSRPDPVARHPNRERARGRRSHHVACNRVSRSARHPESCRP